MTEAAAADRSASLLLESVAKRFQSVHALRGVSVEFHRGEIHALLGANGSGKSTLAKILSGVYEPDEGTIHAFGRAMKTMGPPHVARQMGIRVVHQEAPVVDSLTVAEAVALFGGFGAPLLGKINWRELRRSAASLLDKLNVHVEVSTPCAELAPADRAGLALAIALRDHIGTDGEAAASAPGRIVILDEVTAALPEAEARIHLERIRRIADDGLIVIMVTHRLSELRIADRFTILRDGAVALSQRVQDGLELRQLVNYMIGADKKANVVSVGPELNRGDGPSSANALAQNWYSRERREKSEVKGGLAITIDDLRSTHLGGLSFRGEYGEVVGFVGLRGSGIEELPLILGGGMDARGTVVVGDVQLSVPIDPSAAIKSGLVLVPSDRLRYGGVGKLSVGENILLPDLGYYWRHKEAGERVIKSVLENFNVQPRDAEATFGTLSGGNQQKVLMGKWLSLAPRVLVLDDPTYGVDPGARETILQAISDARARGVCVLFFTTEPEQLLRVCDRIIFLREGSVRNELCGEGLSLEAVTQWCYQ